MFELFIWIKRILKLWYFFRVQSICDLLRSNLALFNIRFMDTILLQILFFLTYFINHLFLVYLFIFLFSSNKFIYFKLYSLLGIHWQSISIILLFLDIPSFLFLLLFWLIWIVSHFFIWYIVCFIIELLFIFVIHLISNVSSGSILIVIKLWFCVSVVDTIGLTIYSISRMKVINIKSVCILFFIWRSWKCIKRELFYNHFLNFFLFI